MKPAGRPSIAPKAAGKKDNCLNEIQRLQREREERRKAAEDYKRERAEEEKRNAENGNFGDVDFQRMVNRYREENSQKEAAHVPTGLSAKTKICIAIRKRPINSKEIKKKDHDSVTCLHPTVIVHDCKFKVDGITKYLDNNEFAFDHTFHEENSTDEIYMYCVQSLVGFVLKGGRATVFAYGQTGSGKTHTMVGIQSLLVNDLYKLLEESSDGSIQGIFCSVMFFTAESQL